MKNDLAYVYISLIGVCFALAGFLMGMQTRGFNGLTVYFQLPTLIFCFTVFCIMLFDHFRK